MSDIGPLTFGQIVCSCIVGGVGLGCAVVGFGTLDLSLAFGAAFGLMGVALLTLAVAMYRRAVGFRSDL